MRDDARLRGPVRHRPVRVRRALQLPDVRRFLRPSAPAGAPPHRVRGRCDRVTGGRGRLAGRTDRGRAPPAGQGDRVHHRRLDRRRGAGRALHRRRVRDAVPLPPRLPPHPLPAGWSGGGLPLHARPALAGEPCLGARCARPVHGERAARHDPGDAARRLRRGGGRRDHRRTHPRLLRSRGADLEPAARHARRARVRRAHTRGEGAGARRVRDGLDRDPPLRARPGRAAGDGGRGSAGAPG